MNDQPVQSFQDRPNTAARLHARLSRFRNLLREKWWVLVLGAMAGAIIKIVLLWNAPPSYVSVGRMIVSMKLAIQPASLYSEELSNFLGTQAALMQCGVVVNRAHERVSAQKPEIGRHAVALNVSVLPKTTIFVLQATGRDRDYTQAFLQACMDEYIALKKEMRSQTSDTTVAGLTEQVMRLEKDLRRAEAEMVQFQSTNSMMLTQEQGNSPAHYLTTLYQRLVSLKSEYALLQRLTLDQNLARRQAASGTFSLGNEPLAEGNDSLPDTNAVALTAGGTYGQGSTAAGDRGDAAYLQAQQQLLLLRAEQQELGRYLRPNHPKMISMQEDIARREELLKILRTQSEEQLKNRKELLAVEIEILEKDLKAWDAKSQEFQHKNAEYQALKANVQRIRALYDQLLATMQTLDVNKEISPESVETIEAASPAYAARLDLWKGAVNGALLGLALGLGLLLVLDRLDDRVGSFTELQDLFDENVLGQVPREKLIASKRQPSLIMPEDTRHSFVEAYRNLRSSLLYMTEAGNRPKTILVTSSVPNDGKSITAANLAITMANAGSRVLLVDADLRKGTLHRLFGVSSEPGLSDVLAKGTAWETTVSATKIANLYLLPAGTFTARSSELFISEATQRFLRDAASRYDYVMFDTVPVMAADDVTCLAPQIDGVIFVLRAAFTSARVARASLESLYQRQVRLLGLVFNAVRPSSEDYYYYRYKDYYRPYPSGGTKAAESARTEQA